jgi:hypothetical protein
MRTRRSPTFEADVVALFARLDAVPARKRRAEQFKQDEMRLAKLLGFDPPWLTGSSVLDRERGPCWPEYMPAAVTWHRCQAVRRELLEAVGRGNDAQPAAK